MADDVAAANVNRTYTIAGTSIAIFTFTLFFLYPRFKNGEANALLFQATIVAMAVATFSFVFATLSYYACSLGNRIDDAMRLRYSRSGDRFWLLGYTCLFLAPSLILFSIGLLVVASFWLALWMVYLVFMIRHFPLVRADR
jgi:hypothetical protein